MPFVVTIAVLAYWCFGLPAMVLMLAICWVTRRALRVA